MSYLFSATLKRIAKYCASLGLAILILLFPLTVKAQVLQVAVTPQAKELFNSGINHTKNGNYDRALLDFTEAIKLEPKLAKAYSNRCLIQIHLKNYLEAKQDCTEALENEPNNESAYLNRGLAHYRLGKYAAAIADYNRVIELKPHSLQAYYNRGLAHAALEKYSQAIADYNQALVHISGTDKNQLATIYNDRALAYLGVANINGAIADFKRAIRFDFDEGAWAYYNLGCICHRQGDYRTAIKYFTESVERNPDSVQAYVNRGLARYQLGYHQAALEDLHFAAKCCDRQGKPAAYQQVLVLIEKLQKSLFLSENLVV